MGDQRSGDTFTGPINSLMYINMTLINMSKTNYVNKSATYNSDLVILFIPKKNLFKLKM